MASVEHLDSKLSLAGKRYCFVKLDDSSRYTFVDPNSEIMCGDVDHIDARVTKGITVFKVKALLEPSPEEWEELFTDLLGWTQVGQVFSVATSIPDFAIEVDRVTKVHTYSTCKVSKAIIRATQGSTPVSLELEMWGLTMAETAAGSFAGTTISGITAPYNFIESTLNLDAIEYNMNSSVIVIDHHLATRWNNSPTASAIAMTERTVHTGFNTPYTATDAALFTEASGHGGTDRLVGYAGDVTFANSGKSTKFDFGNLKWEATPPALPGKPHEIRQPIWFKSFKTSSRPVLEVTNDITE